MTERKTHKPPREFTGRHMLLLMVAFFGVIVAVNMFMMYKAVTTFRGEDIKQSYRQGLDYNQTLKKRAQQVSRGWTAELSVNNDHKLALYIVGQNGLAIRGLQISGVLKHPVETDLDRPLIFIFNPDTQHYISQYPTDIKGKRWVHTAASYGYNQDGKDALFETKNEIWLK